MIGLEENAGMLPFSPEPLPICDRYDSFVTHVLIPILGIGSFLLNDSSLGKLKPMERWHGTWYVTLYAAIILALIGTNALPPELIPYYFLITAPRAGARI